MKYDLEARVFKSTELSGPEKLVMLALVFHLNEKTGQCNPSFSLLEQECGLSDKGLSGILKRLESRRWIDWTRGNGRGKASDYVLFPTEERANGVPLLEETDEPERANEVPQKANGVPLLESQRANGVTPLESERANDVPERANDVPSHIRTERLRTISSSSSSKKSDDFSNSGSRCDLETDLSTPDALTLSLCEACALMPDALGEKHRGQLAEVTAWLLELFPDPATAAREVAVRFGVWDKPKPPHLPQIKSDWNRMMRICEFQKAQNITRNGVSNDANHHLNRQSDRPASGAERRESAWASAIADAME